MCFITLRCLDQAQRDAYPHVQDRDHRGGMVKKGLLVQIYAERQRAQRQREQEARPRERE